jgi:hypothetical protein
VSVRARFGIGIALAVVLGALVPLSSQPTQSVHNMAIDRNLAIESGQVTPDGHEQLLSGGLLDSAREARTSQGGGQQGARSTSGPSSVRIRTLGCPKIFPGRFNNIKVNQDCGFRAHGEEFVVVDPNDPNHVVAGQNDSRTGFNRCGIDYSFDRGQHWGDMVPPYGQFRLLDNRVSASASDPALTFDAQGNVYFSCILFDTAVAANALVVIKSNAQFGGSFFHSPATNPNPGPQEFVTLPLGVVANDNNPTITHDKEFIFSDIQPASPKRGRVYMTWTLFRTTVTGTTIESPINFSQSVDGGATWSPRAEISGRGSMCIGGNRLDPTLPADKCNSDQSSWLVTGRDGTLFVFFVNSNTSDVSIGQYLMVKCLGTSDCTKSANWSPPVKVADDIRKQPFFFTTNPVTGCPGNRRCLPPNGYRLASGTESVAFDFTFGPKGRLYMAFADFRNGGPCASGGNPPRPVEPCANHRNDIFEVHSDDQGATWSPAKLVSSDDQHAAKWQPWLAVGPDGIVYIAYYSRQFGGCETTGCNDIVLAASLDHGKTFKHVRITTSSMPNLVPANNPTQSGFLGDYMNIAANTEGAYIVWADTRPHVGNIPTRNVFYAFIKRSTFGHEQ